MIRILHFLPMRMRSCFLVLPALLFAACGGQHPLGGHWKADKPPAPVEKLGIDFDANSDAVLTHLDTADGHGHKKGTYTFDAATMAVTVKCLVLGDGKSDTWTGKLAGDTLELTGGTDKVTFKKGGSAH